MLDPDEMKRLGMGEPEAPAAVAEPGAILHTAPTETDSVPPSEGGDIPQRPPRSRSPGMRLRRMIPRNRLARVGRSLRRATDAVALSSSSAGASSAEPGASEAIGEEGADGLSEYGRAKLELALFVKRHQQVAELIDELHANTAFRETAKDERVRPLLEKAIDTTFSFRAFSAQVWRSARKAQTGRRSSPRVAPPLSLPLPYSP